MEMYLCHSPNSSDRDLEKTTKYWYKQLRRKRFNLFHEDIDDYLNSSKGFERYTLIVV